MSVEDRIKNAFDAARARGRIALAPYVTIGYPSPSATHQIIKSVAAAGADVIEMGVPFSDPLAEGPTIQRSSFLALEKGVTPQVCLDIVTKLRMDGVTTPFIWMGYYNSVLALGQENFCKRAAAAGFDGLIIPDLPPEEAGPLREAATKHGRVMVPLVALTSTDDRLALACNGAGGFIYCVSVLGVTGARQTVSGRVRNLVERVRRHTSLPVGVGFGISKPEHVAEVARYADGAAVGSALIEAIGNGPEEGAASRAGDFIKSLVAGAKLMPPPR